MADGRDFSEIAADMPEEEEIVFDGSMKAAEAAALTSLMHDSAFLTRCTRRCGPEAVELAQQVYEQLSSQEEAVGSEQDTACWSLINLLKYAAAEVKDSKSG
eukprot:g4412.t1